MKQKKKIKTKKRIHKNQTLTKYEKEIEKMMSKRKTTKKRGKKHTKHKDLISENRLIYQFYKPFFRTRLYAIITTTIRTKTSKNHTQKELFFIYFWNIKMR